ncbi:MAG: phosphoribosylamine--glycine ligase [Acidobacteriota bacterium]|nr:phosphoribosylamine--glycine ligase [Acidobacteriota bacterium]MDQ5836584.1 phosphoribosylamine--glycine ligase [Acidobacteriota bacterium]
MRLLVIGSGGREHALCRTLRTGVRAAHLRLFCAPGNAGIAEDAECVALGATDVAGLADFAESERVELTIVGGEAPLAAGLADEFARRGLVVAGPKREAARLESSKAFAKDFMLRHKVPTARHRVAASVEEALGVLRSGEFGGADSSVVVKADGLAAGKGVVVARTRREAERAVEELMSGGRVGGEAARRVLLEEALDGREASLLLWTDGRDYRLMPAARDHKRVGEGDTGPNTGGMGAITAPGVLDEETLARAVREIVEPTLEGARADRLDFRGVLFVGLMLTTEGPRVLEYNVRFGDPEAQAILVRLRTDLAEIFEAVARRSLGEVEVEWSMEASACVVLAARGYPEKPETGARIQGLEEAARVPSVEIFHAGTTRDEDGAYLTAGGRVLDVTATGATLEQALARCYESASQINWDGLHFRRDIGRF